VEDDAALMLGLEENLKFEGYDVITASDGETGLRAARDRHPDLIVLDVVLPGMTGYQVCRSLRQEGKRMPVVMLTAKGEEVDKITGFDMGADDYVTKPFSVRELLARIRVVLQRAEKRGETGVRYTFGDFSLDLRARSLLRKGKPEQEIVVTRTEFELLACLCENEGRAMSREALLNLVWGVNYLGTQRSLDTFVASLRGKIEEDPKHPRFIHTVHGVGYKFTK
jgi:two-component system, OmpR family, alkaline phosphatase synthesis response regulator PhoP